MSTVVAEAATDQRYRALLVATFGVAGIVLAAVGIFGVVARAVAQRSREMAIRMALGAESHTLQSLVLGSTLLTGVAGTCAGLLLAAWGSRLVSRHLFGVQSSDASVFSIVIAAILAVCTLAGYLPTRRPLRLEPARVLKEE